MGWFSVSKTDKTAPNWVQQKRGECPGNKDCGTGFPCKHYARSKEVQHVTHRETRHERTELRNQLAAGEEPLAMRHRYYGTWEAY